MCRGVVDIPTVNGTQTTVPIKGAHVRFHVVVAIGLVRLHMTRAV